MNKEFKQRPLQSMNTALQNAGRALSKITPNHVRCLAAVNRCQDFISWLKETIKGRRVAKCVMFIRQEYILSVKRERKIDLLYLTVLKRSGLPIDSHCLKIRRD